MLGVGRAGACWQAEQTTVGAGLGAMRPNEPDDAERDAWVVLDGVFGVGPVSFARLIAAFGDGRRVLETALERGGPARRRLWRRAFRRAFGRRRERRLRTMERRLRQQERSLRLGRRSLRLGQRSLRLG